jgi:hypothetical protein
MTTDTEDSVIAVLVRPEGAVTGPVLESTGHFIGQLRPGLCGRKGDGDDIVVAYDAPNGHVRRIIAPERDRNHQRLSRRFRIEAESVGQFSESAVDVDPWPQRKRENASELETSSPAIAGPICRLFDKR